MLACAWEALQGSAAAFFVGFGAFANPATDSSSSSSSVVIHTTAGRCSTPRITALVVVILLLDCT